VKIALVGKGGSGKTTLSGLIGLVGRSGYVRGAAGPLSALEPATREVLDRMRAATDATPRDWAAYTRQAVEFHLRNATAWASDRSGVDLSAQVDPDFTLGPAALEACPPAASAPLGALH
jgi:CO dehydrogenase maturation factor